MAISEKDAAKQIIDDLPEDATLDDIIRALEGQSMLQDRIGQGGVSAVPGDSSGADSDARGDSQTAVTYHLERRGRLTVLVPDRPVPPISAEMVNELIEAMRREREERWLGLTEEDGE